MTSETQPPAVWRWRAARPFWVLAASLLVADQLTKLLVWLYLPLHKPHAVLGDWLQLTHIRNSGGAFGVQWEHTAIYFVFAGVVTIAILLHLAYHGGQRRLSLWAMALVLAGAIGNLIDRASYGNVIDFIDVEFFDMTVPAFNFGIISHEGTRLTRWPIFNIADSCVTLGVIVLLVSMWRDIEIPRASSGSDADSPDGGGRDISMTAT